jgi:uncharacterized protein YjbI with pentapeptide repeats
VRLIRASLYDVYLYGASLNGAHLDSANLDKVALGGTDLSGAHGLTVEQLRQIRELDQRTQLPQGEEFDQLKQDFLRQKEQFRNSLIDEAQNLFSKLT